MLLAGGKGATVPRDKIDCAILCSPGNLQAEHARLAGPILRKVDTNTVERRSDFCAGCRSANSQEANNACLHAYGERPAIPSRS
jgi:hypothetical protein